MVVIEYIYINIKIYNNLLEEAWMRFACVCESWCLCGGCLVITSEHVHIYHYLAGHFYKLECMELSKEAMKAHAA